MHIKHLTLMSGPAGTFPIGHERDIDDAEGRDLVAGGYAVEVKRRAPETATARPGETATAAEQEAAKHLKNIATAGKGGGKGKRTAPAAVPPAPTSAGISTAGVVGGMGSDE
jgi:hypothetical protein